MKIRLEVAHDKNKGTVVRVGKLPFLMGRDPHCELRPASRAISQRHCQLFEAKGRLFVRDLASTNGTFVNDVRIDSDTELRDGDLLRVGPLAFVVHVQVEIPIDAPTPLPMNKKVHLPNDEEVAAMLFELDAEEGAQDNLRGSTDVLPPAPAEEPQRQPVKPVPTAARPTENSIDAAKAILQKYARRDKK